MAIAPRSIAIGIAVGLLAGGGYIAVDRSHAAEEALARAELVAGTRPSAAPTGLASAGASASATATASAATSATPPVASGSAAPGASASGKVSAGASPPGREDMVHVPAAPAFQPSYITKPLEVKAFWLDATEVTQKAYLACVEASGCSPNAWAKSGNKLEGPAQNLPAADVSWEDARAYCGWNKKRLPTEIEWELAARGPEGRKFPWGEEAPLDQLCWRSAQGPCEVGSYPRGNTPLGLKDMGGNVWEWTGDPRFCAFPDKPETCDPHRHAARGGGWNTFSPQLAEASYRNALAAPTNYVGFRCAAD